MNKLNIILKTNELNSTSQKLTSNSVKSADSGNRNETKADRISLSETYKGKSSKNKKGIVSDVRYDLVKKYREILADGSYQIKSSELADKIVQKVKENKNMILL
jgi:anti-sigma28 factor (negative regulator of flagellin synthesis)